VWVCGWLWWGAGGEGTADNIERHTGTDGGASEKGGSGLLGLSYVDRVCRSACPFTQIV
jgi:hypothetical protein